MCECSKFYALLGNTVLLFIVYALKSLALLPYVVPLILYIYS